MLKRYILIVSLAVLAAFSFTVSAQAASNQKSLLWKVSSANRVLYITGDTQVLSSKDYPLPQQIMQGFSRSGELIVEGNTDPGADEMKKVQALVVKDGLLPSSQKLSGLLNAEQQKLVKGAFAEVGFPFSKADSMRPWLAAIVMMQATFVKLGVNPADQETEYFIKQAKHRELPITPLEAGTEQIKMFSGIPPAPQIAWLTSEARQLPEQSALRPKVVAAWRKGDTKELAKMLQKAFRGHPELYRILVTDRNQHWLKVLKSRLDSSGEPVFVVVGAGHLVGPGNLVNALRQAGYKVAQL
ncbi:MAG: TraB/GumN family protein [Gammaproteobacteria bacterium]